MTLQTRTTLQPTCYVVCTILVVVVFWAGSRRYESPELENPPFLRKRRKNCGFVFTLVYLMPHRPFLWLVRIRFLPALCELQEEKFARTRSFYLPPFNLRSVATTTWSVIFSTLFCTDSRACLADWRICSFLSLLCWEINCFAILSDSLCKILLITTGPCSDILIIRHTPTI